MTGKEREINEWKEYFGKAPRISSVTAPTQRAAIKAARSSAASIILLHLRLPPSLTSEFALSKVSKAHLQCPFSVFILESKVISVYYVLNKE